MRKRVKEADEKKRRRAKVTRAGRPYVSLDGAKGKPRCIRFSDDEWNRLKARAAKSRISISELIRRAVFEL